MCLSAEKRKDIGRNNVFEKGVDGTGHASELTRAEYLQLLHTAKALQKERLYFFVKTICCVGLKIGETSQFTIDMVKAGEGTVVSKGTERKIVIPAVLAKELLEFAERKNITEGILFRTSAGTPLNRINSFNMLRELAAAAGISVEKCSPKSLREVYLRTQQEIYDSLDYIAKQAYEQLITAEQTISAWEKEI